MAVEQLAQERLQHASARQQTGVAERGEVGTTRAQSDRHRLLVVDLRNRRGGHHESEVAEDALDQVGSLVERVRVDGESGLGLEGAAREARYGAFAGRVAPGETLWLAQHRDDQGG